MGQSIGGLPRGDQSTGLLLQSCTSPRCQGEAFLPAGRYVAGAGVQGVHSPQHALPALLGAARAALCRTAIALSSA